MSTAGLFASNQKPLPGAQRMSLVTSQTAAPRQRAPFGRRHRLILGGLYLLALALIALLVIDGYAYYSMPYSERPHHADYRDLRPAGSRGLLYGVIGSEIGRAHV